MTGERPILRLLGVAGPVSGRLAAAALLGAAASGCAVGLMATSAWLISRAAQRPPVLELTIAIVAVRAFGVFRGVLRYGERLAGHDAALRVLALLRVACYRGLERIAPRRLAGGDALSRYASDVDAGMDVLVRVILPYGSVALIGAATAVLLGLLLPAAGLSVAVGLLVVAFAVPAIHAALARRGDRVLAPLRGELTHRTVDLLVGLPDLVAAGAVPRQLARLSDVDSRLGAATRRSSAGVGAGAGLVVLVTGACVLVNLTAGTDAVRAGRISGVVLAVLVLTPLAMFEVASALPPAAAQLAAARSALRRVFAVVDAPDPVPVTPPAASLPAAPFHLRVEGVSAGWGAGEPDVLTGLTLDLPPGARVAVVGPSGSGKSTLAALLVRFIDARAGRVTLNGADIRRLDPDALRQVVGLLDDDAYCFDTTISENVRVGRRGATDADVAAALTAAGLGPFLAGLPEGLATPVGEHGRRLSGGQRRRLALARMLLADPPIVVLDEPTEHLDEPAARELTKDLLSAVADRTVVLITHRGFGLDQVDHVLTLPASTPSEDRDRIDR